ncbi:type II and III secretion system protein family protein [Marinobacter salicampi]|uniref:type II and III secretion system protein family protein n=1 Tax=Marinobacter salicampi TaxID=435907 RepID=UPI00140E309B|nr:pilus assembly protein N-terminal domain-containing protein [Marinobacter salicampi]
MTDRMFVLRGQALMLMLLCTVFFSAGLDAKTRYLRMHMGETRVLDMPDVKRVAVGNPNVVNYRPLDNGQLVLTATGPGETSLEIWAAGDRQSRLVVTVSEANLSRKLHSAREIASSIDGVTVREVDGLMVLDGRVAQSDLGRLEMLMNALPGAVNLTRTQDFSMDRMVLMDVRIVEVSSRAAQQLGIRWGTVAAGPTIGFHAPVVTNSQFFVVTDTANGLAGEIGDAVIGADQNFFSYLGLTSGLGSQIDLMAETGFAKILAAPKLVTRSGEVAAFHSGGEIPYQTVDELGRPIIQFRDFGIKLDIEPLADEDGNILVRLGTEVSSIDRANQIGDTPGLRTRAAESVINVVDGETIVISGLASTSLSNQVTKVPFLGDIPFLGALFRSTEKVDEQTEIAVFVTPQLMTPESERNKRMLEAARDEVRPLVEDRLNQAFLE